MWTAIITYILSIISNITGWIKNKSDNKDLSNNQKAIKFQQETDKHKKIVHDAIINKDLDKIRKEISE